MVYPVLSLASISFTLTPVEREVEMAGIYESTRLKTKGSTTYSGSLRWLLFLLPFLLGAGIIAKGISDEKSGKYDPELIRKEKAYAVAVARLETSRKHMEANNGADFYQEMIVALKTYVTDKYDIPALHVKKSELISQLGEKEVAASDISVLEDIVTKSEMGMYAPGGSSGLQEIYDNALELISRLEK